MQAKPDFILPLSDASAGVSQVGGKGASLARLAAAGLPVPPGFHITTAACRRFVAEHGLQEQILAAVSDATPDQPATLEEASRRIRQLFAQHAIPDDVAETIRRAYAGLGEGDLPVAVRSSATAEDLPGASFAGQQETYLNIRGAEAVLEAVKRCWASLWTARAIAYRARQGIAPGSVALAVVVQELVIADAAGVLFTANPLTGKRDEIVINAAWGLGEAIVSGAVTPDTLTVERATGRIVSRETAEKQTMTARAETGSREVPVPASQKKKAVLTDAQVAELAKLAAVAEAAKNREAVRSESIRLSRLVTRPFLLQVGNVMGIGDGVFFLTMDEMTALLAGDKTSLSAIPARREMHRRYCALPPYPALIYGRFDPFRWAADPKRRSDCYDARQTGAAAFSSTVKGVAGAVGCVEGIVRRIDRVEDGNQIQPGEILVTSITNVGWTPLFPRLAAIVTDVGAPLSHAAIVAREMGIPAVVGCGNATMLLKKGDHVRVDGGRGTVEILTG